jgi:hypothetical protein
MPLNVVQSGALVVLNGSALGKEPYHSSHVDIFRFLPFSFPFFFLVAHNIIT